MSREGKAPRRRNAGRKAAEPSSNIASIFESRPDESLLNADALAALYSTDCPAQEAEDRAYRTLLPLIKNLFALYKEHPHLETSGNFRIACAVCPNQTLLRGWSPLHIHAQKYWKRFPHQHQGYHRALTEVLRAEKLGSIATAATTDALAWPPVLLVENGGRTTFDGSLRRWKGLQGVDVPGTINDIELEEVLAIFKKSRGDDRNVIVFPASEVGLVDVEKLTEALDESPGSDDCLKLRVGKLGSSDQQHHSCNSSIDPHADNANHINRRVNREDDASTSESGFDYEKHRPLGTWATLKEIRDTGRVDSIMGKWAKGFTSGKDYSTFAYKWPFQKSKKLREMDIKFQKNLQKYHALGAVGNEKLKAQLAEIEKQLRNERLLWLKEVTGVREQFEGLEKDIKNEEAQKALDKHIWKMRLERENDSEIEESEELSCQKNQIQLGRPLLKKSRQHVHDMERKRGALLREWRYEQNTFRKQAELAKEERDCINRSMENEEMLEAISRILEGCGCLHKGDNIEDCGCDPCCTCDEELQDSERT